MTRGNRFVRGAAVLAGAGLVSKVLGSVYTIFLQNIIGDRGLGLYQMAYPIYATLVILATAGLPVAVSKFVAERAAVDDAAGASRVFRVSAAIMGAIGAAGFCLLFFGAERYAAFVGNPDAALALRAVAPAMLLVPVMSVARGYFQGFQEMMPTAASQVAEQTVRVITIISLSWWMMVQWHSPEWAAAGAAFGAVTGALAGCAVLWRDMTRGPMIWGWGSRGDSGLDSRWGKDMVLYALPVSLGALAVPLINNVDALTVVNSLKAAGLSSGVATEMFGWLSGRAFKLMILPATFAGAVAVALLPSLTSAMTRRDLKAANHQVELGLRLTLWLSLPASIGLILLAAPVDRMLFRDTSGLAAIQITSLAMVFSSLQVTASSILQSVGRPWAPVWHLAVAVAAKGILNVLWVPRWGIEGAAAATVVAYAVAALLNIVTVMSSTGLVLHVRQLFWRPLVASIGMAAVVALVLQTLGGETGANRWESAMVALSAVVLGGIAYFVLLLIVGGFSRGELESLPRVGPVLARVGTRFGWLK
ncbi:polysaccharide biosynthesis protein [Kyrpidia spormannii]|uniref:Polysaccharide biosynthesis protein n=1 Tax=Kyrpidia spormannii TaxID=2055160 RepID=A0A2K8N4Z7_9BACL|nr:polysaccharide biosynthesis protein [Kyrpidia spormannii]ATY83630.1 polysaccharide biosynthesis protein [Kyrpidia spormannii]